MIVVYNQGIEHNRIVKLPKSKTFVFLKSKENWLKVLYSMRKEKHVEL